MASSEGDFILDFFAGSGTTSAVAHMMNRKYVAVEMGSYFDIKTLIRMKNVLFGKQSAGISKEINWDGGGLFKYQNLEQYEETLNNIDFKKPNQTVLDSKNYKIKYMLGFESRDNNAFMNVEAPENPFDYTLNIKGGDKKIDLIETFNYVAGIKVKKILKKQDSKKENYVVVEGERNRKSVLVIWRNLKNIDKKKDKEFIESEFNLADFDEVFVNGDSLVKDAKSLDVIMKEEIFGGI